MRVSRREFVGGVLATAGAAGIAPGGRRAFGATTGGEVVVSTPLGRLRGETEAGVRVFRGVPVCGGTGGAAAVSGDGAGEGVGRGAGGDALCRGGDAACGEGGGGERGLPIPECVGAGGGRGGGEGTVAGVCVDPWRGIYGWAELCAGI